MTASPLTIALPSKGRLMEQAESLFARAGYRIERTGAARGYRGIVTGIKDIEVAFLSSSEIAQALKDGTIDLGVTGEDLLREKIDDVDSVLDITMRLGFGPADVVVAVPECWLDVATMSDLDDVSV
ncbi:MAG: ATP phosphoribosyltransferase, partial [Hyphomicrobiales bacterium]|nr:ATP phosphoribosyltransferase [Hyphomicrobiales bacterium]